MRARLSETGQQEEVATEIRDWKQRHEGEIMELAGKITQRHQVMRKPGGGICT